MAKRKSNTKSVPCAMLGMFCQVVELSDAFCNAHYIYSLHPRRDVFDLSTV